MKAEQELSGKEALMTEPRLLEFSMPGHGGWGEGCGKILFSVDCGTCVKKAVISMYVLA